MITRSQVKKLGDNNEVKSMLESIKLELIGKIDALSDKLYEKNVRIDELENRIVLMEEKLAYSDNNLNFWNVVWMITNSMAGEQALE